MDSLKILLWISLVVMLVVLVTQIVLRRPHVKKPLFVMYCLLFVGNGCILIERYVRLFPIVILQVVCAIAALVAAVMYFRDLRNFDY